MKVGTKAPKFAAASVRAVRPASLAASAPTVVLEALAGRSGVRAAVPLGKGFFGAASGPEAACFLLVGKRGSSNGQESKAFALQSFFSAAPRSSAAQSNAGRAGTSYYAARAGGFGLLASSATQRTMRAGRVQSSALPNPSIERTFSGKPENASHLKR